MYIIIKMLENRVKPIINSNHNKNYKQPIKEIISSSSLAYLLSPIRSRRLLIKIIWIVFLIGFLFASIYFVLINIFEYLLYETNTSIYQINEPQADFPTISFCSTCDLNFNIKILGLWFKNEELTNEWQNYFETYTDPGFGNCYRFNGGKNMSNHSIPIRKAKSGRDEGIWLYFYYNQTLFDSIFTTVTLYIHNNTQMPSNLYSKGYYIRPGSFNFYDINRVHDQKLELPYNNCYKNVSKSDCNQTIINYMILKKIQYSHIECLYLCKNLRFNEINACNFSLNSLDQDIYSEMYKLNDYSNALACISAYFKESNNNIYCSNYCPYECDTFTYDINSYSMTTKSSGNIDYSETFFNTFGFNSYDNVSNTFFAFIVYYNDLQYTLIKQHPKIELFDLISNVGGTLGLFLGFSFISLLEAFEVLAELLFVRLFD